MKALREATKLIEVDGMLYKEFRKEDGLLRREFYTRWGKGKNDLSILSSIEADSITIGDKVSIGSCISIRVRGQFVVGDYSVIGPMTKIVGEEVIIGSHFYGTGDLQIGGGGSLFKNAVVHIGNRCVMHNNYLNNSMPITIGNDVGLSPDVQIITHGFWNSALDGFPTTFREVIIESGVIIGQRSMVLPGAFLSQECVIGAQSVIRGRTQPRGVYSGNPAELRYVVEPPSNKDRADMLLKIVEQFITMYADYVDMKKEPVEINVDYPNLTVNGVCIIDVERCCITDGEESTVTDDIRDYLRRYGIRIYTSRPFGRIVT